MKKLYTILYVMILIVLSSLVYAEGNDDLVIVINMDELAGDANDSSVNRFNFTNNGATANQPAKNSSFGTAYNFNGVNQYLRKSTEPVFDFGGLDYYDFCILAWVKADDWDGTEGVATIIGNYDGTTSFTFITEQTNKLTLSVNSATGGAGVTHNMVDTTPNGNWTQVVATRFNGATRMGVMENNNASSTYGIVTARDISGSTSGINIGRFGDGSGGIRYWAGRIDEVVVLNRTCTIEDINWHYGNQFPLPEAPPPGLPSTPVIVLPSPTDNANNNTNVILNVTHSTLLNDVRYYLYFGSSSSLVEGDLVLDNVTRTGDEYKEFNTVVGDGIYYWKWKVQNITNGLLSANTTQRTWTLDTVNPTITLLPNNNWKTDNTTIISNNRYNLTLNVSFYDNNLPGGQTLINITNESDQSVYSILNTSITENTVNYSRLIDISTWAIGNYTIKLEATDPHTLTQIKKYETKTGFTYFRYTTTEGNTIKITSDTFPLTKRTNKLTDRYDFEFNYLFQKDTYKFTIESYNKITYLENSKDTIGPHFIIMSEGINGNWIDFENPNLKKEDYKVTKIDDYIYEIEITANGIKSFKFNSLGGLNKVEEHYKIRLGAVIDIWIYDEENPGVQINATATIGTQSNTSIINISPATLVNITKEITSVTLTSLGFGEEAKAISITESYHNFSFNMTPVLATKINFIDEISEELIIGETFSVFLEKPGFSNTYSGITDNPETITGLEEGLYKLKASSANYQEREYQNLNISNTTTTILNVYLINNTLGQEVTFTVQGSGGEKLDNADVDFFRIINGTNTLIAQENTDFAGQAKLFLDPNYEYDINLVRAGYISRNITLEPSNTEYTIILLSGEAPYESNYAGVRFRFYYNGVMTVSPPDIINLTNTTHNITFEVEGDDLEEIGINFSNHNYACTPASCSVTLAGEGQVTLRILLNESGTFNTAYYFKKNNNIRIYVNDGLIKVIPFIFNSLDGLPEWIISAKEELSPNLRTLLVAMLNVIAVGVGSSLGLAGTALIIPVLAVTVIVSLPEIGLIHPFIGMIIAVFGVTIYVYSQMR